MQTCDCLLLLQWIGTPFVMCQWVIKPWWAFILAFVQVFILWCLNCIAIEIENPFGMDDNDIDADKMQSDMNRNLMLLLQPQAQRMPRLLCPPGESLDVLACNMTTFAKTWSTMGGDVRRSCRTGYRPLRRTGGAVSQQDYHRSSACSDLDYPMESVSPQSSEPTVADALVMKAQQQFIQQAVSSAEPKGWEGQRQARPESSGQQAGGGVPDDGDPPAGLALASRTWPASADIQEPAICRLRAEKSLSGNRYATQRAKGSAKLHSEGAAADGRGLHEDMADALESENGFCV